MNVSFVLQTLFIVLVSGNIFSIFGPPDDFHYGERDGNLFLDIPISQVLAAPPEWGFVEPWAGNYVAALQEERYGDAIWARYQMFGNTSNGTYLDYPGWTVREALELDAIGYRLHERDNWKYALTVYAKSSKNDTHSDILDLMTDINRRSYYRLCKLTTPLTCYALF
ncbi:hypothetical protein FBEOM_3878 [Fusarium beomiforme]|uniref:Uncharacterized protein n=1 Tax=Fusarium beomiforme TaxID=44412 RepID=A0A9P5E0F4_9HYPO|nr:hypothetical protein FBEOM_3878 [Fusarium beomiforme]